MDHELIDHRTISSIADVGMQNGQEGYYSRLLRLFEAQAEKIFSDMDIAMHKSDLDSLASHAHKLKGSAHTMGAPHLGSACSKLEILTSGPSRDSTEIQAAIDSAYDIYLKSIDQLKIAASKSGR